MKDFEGGPRSTIQSLGHWAVPSGNDCEALLTLDGLPTSIEIRLVWRVPPSVRDREHLNIAVMPEVFETAYGRIQERAAFSRVLQELLTIGTFKRAGVDERGEPRYTGTNVTPIQWRKRHRRRPKT